MPRYDYEGGLYELLEHFAKLLSCDQAFTVVSKRGGDTDTPLLGWQPRWVFRLLQDSSVVFFEADAERWVHDPLIQHVVQGSGETRVFRNHHLLKTHDWRDTPVTQQLEEHGLVDRAVSVCSIDPETEVYVGVDATHGEPFTQKQADLLLTASLNLTPFLRGFVRFYGYTDASAPFSPRERETLQHLLRGLSEKNIADAMGITRGTAHQYVVAIYRKFGVSSRAELMTQWL